MAFLPSTSPPNLPSLFSSVPSMSSSGYFSVRLWTHVWMVGSELSDRVVLKFFGFTLFLASMRWQRSILGKSWDFLWNDTLAWIHSDLFCHRSEYSFPFYLLFACKIFFKGSIYFPVLGESSQTPLCLIGLTGAPWAWAGVPRRACYLPRRFPLKASKGRWDLCLYPHLGLIAYLWYLLHLADSTYSRNACILKIQQKNE